MSENCDSDYSSGGKKKPINKDYKRRRTTMKEAKQEGKLMLECEFCPTNKKKIYLSFPALYFHVNDKHPGSKVTSAKAREKGKKANELAPVLKLNSILKETDPEREKVERELLDIKQYLCYKLSEAFISQALTQFAKIGERGAQRFVNQVREISLNVALELRLKRDFFLEAEKGEIFRDYFTRVAPISFGKDLVRFFAKNTDLCSKIHLEMILMECLDQSLIDKAQFKDFEVQLWGQQVGLMGIVKEHWVKWRAINKEGLMEDYSEDEGNKQQ